MTLKGYNVRNFVLTWPGAILVTLLARQHNINSTIYPQKTGVVQPGVWGSPGGTGRETVGHTGQRLTTAGSTSLQRARGFIVLDFSVAI